MSFSLPLPSGVLLRRLRACRWARRSNAAAKCKDCDRLACLQLRKEGPKLLVVCYPLFGPYLDALGVGAEGGGSRVSSAQRACAR